MKFNYNQVKPSKVVGEEKDKSSSELSRHGLESSSERLANSSSLLFKRQLSYLESNLKLPTKNAENETNTSVAKSRKKLFIFVALSLVFVAIISITVGGASEGEWFTADDNDLKINESNSGNVSPKGK